MKKKRSGFPLLSGALGATRTRNLLLRKQALYPLSYGGTLLLKRTHFTTFWHLRKPG
jgi:hypothetical protein